MNVVGIIGEYNPFHMGHMHHIAESRKIAGEDAAVVCVMSGNFAQRGEPSVFSKFARAEAAVRCGADLVFELPLPWSLASAEGFARGAVGLLGAAGVVTHLSFGSETGNVEPLEQLAAALVDPALDKQIKAEASSGERPYAAVRQSVIQRELGDSAKLLETPNNILAVEYLKAIMEQRLNITPITIKRSGAGHDRKASHDEFRSASELRGMLRLGSDAYSLMPREAAAVFMREAHNGRGPVFSSSLETAIISRLRMLDGCVYDALPDEGDGLGRRLMRAACSETSLDSIYAAAKTKRFALSRIRRMSMCAALGVRSGMAAGTPPYARVLSATSKGCDVLRMAATSSHIPVITKPASVRELPAEDRALFSLECSADDLYVLGYPAKAERGGGATWRTSPFIFK